MLMYDLLIFLFMICIFSIQYYAFDIRIVTNADGTKGISLIEGENKYFIAPFPLSIKITDITGNGFWMQSGYSQINCSTLGIVRHNQEKNESSSISYHNISMIKKKKHYSKTYDYNCYDDVIVCSGNIVSPNGSIFHFSDIFTRKNQTFLLQRSVEIKIANKNDYGFSSRFGVAPFNITKTLSDFDVFAPSIWYADNKYVPPSAIAHDMNQEVISYREERLALPLTMLREKNSGITIRISHHDANPLTFFGDDGLSQIVDERLQYGALGIFKNGTHPSLSFVYPGTEGMMTYIHGSSTKERWALRAHPIKPNVSHSYDLMISLAQSLDFASSMSQTWRSVYEEYSVPIFRADLVKIYNDSINLLQTYFKTPNNCPGFPFSIKIPSGEVDPNKINFQMGFIGQQIPAAYLLIKNGFKIESYNLIHLGEEIIDFWSYNSPMPSGLPRVWFDPTPAPPHWRNFDSYLRITSDGMQGVLWGWYVMHNNSLEKPNWLRFAVNFGQWLVTHQNEDGSWYCRYDQQSKPVSPFSKLCTTHPIPFLVDLYQVTGNKTYLMVVTEAGKFSYAHIHTTFAYVAGTPDNPNVMDKEAGMMAFNAFLALYDLLQNKKWLNAAIQAASFVETWTYSWNIPVPPGDPNADFPSNRKTIGVSLIATGHSGADTCISYTVWGFYRLYLYTADTHYLHFARMVVHNTKQLLDWDGTLHYAHPGLQLEAMSFAVPRGHSVGVWLPWLTVSTLLPLNWLDIVFGSLDVDEIEKLSLQKRNQLNHQYALTRGFVGSPFSINSCIVANEDRPGGDLHIIKHVKSADECLQFCQNYTNCDIFSFIKDPKHKLYQQCFLKAYDADVPTTRTYSDTGVRDCIHFTPCFLENEDHVGGDVEIIPNTMSAVSCQQLCQKNSQCSHFVWIRDKQNQNYKTCFLKSEKSSPASSNKCCVSGPKQCTTSQS